MLTHIKRYKLQILLCFIVSICIIPFFYWRQHKQQLSLTRHQEKVKGCYVILIRNSELDGIVSTMTQIESTFNNKFDYPYIFLNDEDFTLEFKQKVTKLTKATTLFGKLNETMWGYPSFINQTYARECREKMAEKGIPYASSESYRHMCRFQSGYFFRHPLLDGFEYYWRLEPYVNYYCQIDYDVFKYMKDHKKKYGFNIAYKEHIETVPTLWQTVMKFTNNYPHLIPPRNSTLFEFVTNDNGKTYNTCHFWSNFEIADLSFYRSEAYLKLFDHLDRSGGFYYERWGDAPVHSIAAALLLRKQEIHFFNDIGYRHTAYTHCPQRELNQRCSCDPAVNFDFEQGLSCYPYYLAAMDHQYKNLVTDTMTYNTLWPAELE